MGFFNRIFKMGQAEAHSALDKLENPIKLTEQGIRDLKKDLQASLQSLAEVKSIAIRMERDTASKRNTAADYEKKAMLLLERGKSGAIEMSEAERLALEALTKKEEAAKQAISLEQEKERHNQMVAKLEGNVRKLKSQIGTYENELLTLKARYKTASATKKLNKQMAKVDSSGTIAMMEKMRNKVEEDESLAAAYGDIASIDKSVDSEIDSALKGSSSVEAKDSLASLKSKMGI